MTFSLCKEEIKLSNSSNRLRVLIYSLIWIWIQIINLYLDRVLLRTWDLDLWINPLSNKTLASWDSSNSHLLNRIQIYLQTWVYKVSNLQINFNKLTRRKHLKLTYLVHSNLLQFLNSNSRQYHLISWTLEVHKDLLKLCNRISVFLLPLIKFKIQLKLNQTRANSSKTIGKRKMMYGVKDKVCLT